MKFEEFLAEFKSEKESYLSAGLIDDISVYKWVTQALKPLGGNIMVMQDAIVDIKGSEGTLPSNFFSLEAAYLCEPKGYYCKEEERPVLQRSWQWVERVEQSMKWRNCDFCCLDDVEEKIITEKVYFNDVETKLYYKNPVLLKLGKGFKRSACTESCRNLVVRSCPNEIVINGNTLFTNFKEGTVYIQFYGMELDEQGFVIIPELGLGNIEQYVTTYVNWKFYEKLLTNQDEPNVVTLFQYYSQMVDKHKMLALTESKFSKLTPSDIAQIGINNRRLLDVYEKGYSFSR